MFVEAANYIKDNCEKDGGFFLWFEADMIPSSKNWLEMIKREWELHQAHAIGHQISLQNYSLHPNLPEHINGGGCFDKSLASLIDLK